jgi:hypothetical protein
MTELTQDYLKTILDYNQETGVFSWKVRKANRYPVGTIAGSIESKGYIQIGINGKYYMAHRLAWFYVHGEWPIDQIDHINRIKTDNKLSNIRCVSQSENMQNKISRGTYFRKDNKKWQAHIKIPGGKFIRLGHFDSEEKAHQAYVDAKKKFHTHLPISIK